MKSGDYDDLREVFRPGHGDFTYQAKYGIRDHRGGGRASARETVARVAAGAVAQKVLDRDQIKALAYTLELGGVLGGHEPAFAQSLRISLWRKQPGRSTAFSQENDSGRRGSAH